jgi:hypothetical protein
LSGITRNVLSADYADYIFLVLDGGVMAFSGKDGGVMARSGRRLILIVDRDKRQSARRLILLRIKRNVNPRNPRNPLMTGSA